MEISGIIFDIKHYAIHDGPGIRTTVFLKGCPLDCWWCHNPESRLLEPETLRRKILQGNARLERCETVGRQVTAGAVLQEIEKERIFFDDSGGGVTFSGGEPLLQIDFLAAMLDECHQREIHTAVDTSGYAPWEDFEKINPFVKLYLYDLKLMDPDEHLKFTGVPNKLIHDNLKRLVSEGKEVEIRVPLIPGISDKDKNLNAIGIFLSFLTSVKQVTLLPYNIFGRNKYQKFHKLERLKNLKTQTDEELNLIKEKFELFGLETKIGE